MSDAKTYYTTISRRVSDALALVSTPTAHLTNGVALVSTGCDVTAFQRNPIVLFDHDARLLPIAGATSITIGDDGVWCSWRWLEHDAVADRVRTLWDQGLMRGCSVGYHVMERIGMTVTRWRLTEISVVPRPANPDTPLPEVDIWRRALAARRRRVTNIEDDDDLTAAGTRLIHAAFGVPSPHFGGDPKRRRLVNVAAQVCAEKDSDQ